MQYSTRIHFISDEKEIPQSLDSKLIKIDCKNIYTKEELFNEFSKVLQFPSYFGKNWDAFDECFWDMEWIKDKYHIKNLNIYIFNIEKLLCNEAILEKKKFFGIVNSDYIVTADDEQGNLNFPMNIQLFFNNDEKKYIYSTDITILWNSL